MEPSYVGLFVSIGSSEIKSTNRQAIYHIKGGLSDFMTLKEVGLSARSVWPAFRSDCCTPHHCRNLILVPLFISHV